MTQLYVILAVVLVIALAVIWICRLVRRDVKADVMEQINDDAFTATKIREEVDRMSSSDVRDALRMRRAK